MLAERYAARGRAYLDLSVLHDNSGAIALYRKLGFTRVAGGLRQAEEPDQQPLFSAPPAGYWTNSTPTRGSSPTRRCAAASAWR